MKRLSAFLIILVIPLCCAFSPLKNSEQSEQRLKWINFNASSYALEECLLIAREYKDSGFTFARAVAYLALKNGNNFVEKSDRKNIKILRERLSRGDGAEELLGGKYGDYYARAYGAALDGIVGEYTLDGKKEYGLRWYFPIANGYNYRHYDDFGNSRSYGFKRKHLGHDLMGSIGTPIIAVEYGVVTECGWNKYGGWRLGIRSADGKRYFYYAHLRKDKPFADGIEKGKVVRAGEMIGYLGMTGYSSKENVNLKSGSPHLHFGIQLLPSETGKNEIWIDVYELTKFLAKNKATVKNVDGKLSTANLKEWKSPIML